MNTRKSKIAHLPKDIREELNRRLEDGETGTKLLRWLNSLRIVKAILAGDFKGQPISESNLTHWRQGGYVDWLRHDESTEHLYWMIDRSDHLEMAAGDQSLRDRLTRIATVELARQTRELNDIPDPAQRWKKFQEIAHELCRLQNCAAQARHAQTAADRWKWEYGEKLYAAAKNEALEKYSSALFKVILPGILESLKPVPDTAAEPKADPGAAPQPEPKAEPDLNQIEPN